jgi:putative SOS response-associated peptidase YedK
MASLPSWSVVDDGVMCGRFALTTPAAILAETFHLPDAPDLPPRYNVAPTQLVAVVREVESRRELRIMRWGLVPSWSREGPSGAPLINARAETVAEKPSFRQAFRSRRCLLPADGFIEWATINRRKMPFLFQRDDGAPFAFAGLWEQWRQEDGQTLLSCAIVTTTANEVVRSVHDRMPVILDPEQYETWLRQGGTEMLRPYAVDRLISRPINPLVNSPRNDSPECLQVAP